MKTNPQKPFLRIPEPCHENWEHMSVSEGGRLCSSCNKKVFDLSKKSNEEITKMFIENGGHLCGRVATAQLNGSAKHISHNSFFSFRKIAAGFLAFLGFNVASTHNAAAQTIDVKKLDEGGLRKQGIHYSNNQTTADSSIQIQGRLRDKDEGEGLVFANIVIEQNGKQIGYMQTDDDGNFYTKLFAVKDNSFIDIKVSYLGYENLNIINLPVKKSTAVNLELQANSTVLGMMEVGVLICEPHLVKMDETSTGKTFTKEDIKHLPK